MTNQIYIDIYQMAFFGSPVGRVGFQVSDDASTEVLDVYDEWPTVEAFLEAFPSEDHLLDFVMNETLYAKMARSGVPINLRGREVWSLKHEK